MAYLVKLVRDHMPCMDGTEGIVTYGPVTREDHVRLLRQKLAEEVGEYLTSPGVGELTDLLAVVRDLAEVDQEVSWDEIRKREEEKREKRGGFSGGSGMFLFHQSDPV